ncbi:hypothetical protein Tco_0575773, partial [Tanacetum coccineum]
MKTSSDSNFRALSNGMLGEFIRLRLDLKKRDGANNSGPGMSFDTPASLDSGGDSRPDLSFDKLASSERLFSLARVSLEEASKLDLSFGHPDAAIDNPRPAAGSFNMADVHRLSAYVIKLRDMPEGVLVLSGLSRVWKSRVCDPVLRGADGNIMGIHDFLCLPELTGADVQEEPDLDVRSTLQWLPFYCTPPAAADVVIPDPTPKDLAVGTPSSKIVAKAEASQKQKASTSGAASSHVAKHTRSAMAQSSNSTTRPSLFVGDDNEIDDDDDDACVEIP